MTGPQTLTPEYIVSVLEVLTGIFALVIALHLQVMTPRQVKAEYWGGFYILGVVLTLSQVGALIPDPQQRLAVKVLYVSAMFAAEFVVAYYVWDKSDLPGPVTAAKQTLTEGKPKPPDLEENGNGGGH